MSYKENCVIHRDTIVSNFEKAYAVENFFTASEIEQLTLLQFKLADRIKWTPSSNNIQPVCNVDTIFDQMSVLDEKFTELLGDYSKNHTGNYYITTQLHDAHVDLITEREASEFAWTDRVIPYKSVVIPLLLSDHADAHTAFYKQRHIGFSLTFDRANISSQDNSMYEIAREYPEFYTLESEEYTGKTYITPQVPPENLQGIELETVLPFKLGSVMVFDSCQIHASCVDRRFPNYKWLKSGINIQFYKEI
jgi:hypothetical protein